MLKNTDQKKLLYLDTFDAVITFKEYQHLIRPSQNDKVFPKWN